MNKEKKDTQTHIRMTAEELEALRNDAFSHRKTITGYIKWLIEKERAVIKDEK